ncbi:cation:proton antiporter, partial [Bryobacter aggregatus]|uniref:cation:proton antiporter n=1 Tax=Bryobacter aggregatus TaxID=360054 RepID=UPI0004E12B91
MGIASDFVLIVVAGLFGGLLARLLRLPLLVGYVAAGVIVGPYTAGPTVAQIHDIELLAEIGVALLLFSLGLEISFSDLKPVRRVALIGGPIQVLVTLALAASVGIYFLHIPIPEAVWLGAMISLSSTMVVLKTLAASGRTSTLASRVMIGFLVIQDLAVIPMLIILPQLNDLDNILPKLGTAIGIAAVFLAAVVLIGTRVLPVLLKGILTWGSRELFLVAVVAIGIGVGYATHLVGISFALGAFVAGIILSESEFSHQALTDIIPLRDIFGLIFFVSVGMLFDPAYVAQHIFQILTTVILIFLGKAIIFGVVTRSFGYGNMAPWIVGLGLCQIGEFSFVLARSGLSSGALSKPIYDLALTCTILTMALSPMVSGFAVPLAKAWLDWRKPKSPKNMAVPQESLSGHAIVAGFGRSGRAAAKVLRDANIHVIVVDSDYALLRNINTPGVTVIWGDISSPEILHAAQVDHASILIFTMPNQSAVHLGVERAHRINPNLPLIARASQEIEIDDLLKSGATSIVLPEREGGLEMGRLALERLATSLD